MSRGVVGGSETAKAAARPSGPVAQQDAPYSATASLLDQIDAQLAALHVEATELFHTFGPVLSENGSGSTDDSARPGYAAPLLRRLASQSDALTVIRDVIVELKTRSVL